MKLVKKVIKSNISYKNDLASTNEYLRKIIKERSDLLNTQENQLNECAFINSHMLGGPISTLKGLLNLRKISSQREDEATIQKYMVETVQKLDNIVVTITTILDNRKVLEHNILR